LALEPVRIGRRRLLTAEIFRRHRLLGLDGHCYAWTKFAFTACICRASHWVMAIEAARLVGALASGASRRSIICWMSAAHRTLVRSTRWSPLGLKLRRTCFWATSPTVTPFTKGGDPSWRFVLI